MTSGFVEHFRLRYDLLQHGWAEITVETASGAAPMRVSYLSDALRDLLDSVWELTRGTVETTAAMEEEPSRWQWTFTRSEDRVVVSIRELDGSRSGGRPVLTAGISLLELASQVCGEAARILAEVGEDGYRERWVANPFPSTSYQRLRAWVSQQR